MNNKKLKLPNGFGSVGFRNGRLRRPYIVRITDPLTKKQKIIGYAESYEKGLEILVDFHKDPQKLLGQKMTFERLFHLMADEKYSKITLVTKRNYFTAFYKLKSIYNKDIRDLRPADLQKTIDDASSFGIKSAAQKKMRQVIHQVYTYAIKYDFIKHDYSTYIEIDKYQQTFIKTPFSLKELEKIKKSAEEGNFWCKLIYTHCLCGCRPSELLRVKKNEVFLKDRYFIVKESKTEAGRNRQVPISKKSLPYFQEWMAQEGEYLLQYQNRKISYHTYLRNFQDEMKRQKMKHTPHECRHTCATLLDNADANQIAIKKILGHACKDVTGKVYTHKSLTELIKAIDKI